MPSLGSNIHSGGICKEIPREDEHLNRQTESGDQPSPGWEDTVLSSGGPEWNKGNCSPSLSPWP